MNKTHKYSKSETRHTIASVIDLLIYITCDLFIYSFTFICVFLVTMCVCVCVCNILCMIVNNQRIDEKRKRVHTTPTKRDDFTTYCFFFLVQTSKWKRQQYIKRAKETKKNKGCQAHAFNQYLLWFQFIKIQSICNKRTKWVSDSTFISLNFLIWVWVRWVKLFNSNIKKIYISMKPLLYDS